MEKELSWRGVEKLLYSLPRTAWCGESVWRLNGPDCGTAVLVHITRHAPKTKKTKLFTKNKAARSFLQDLSYLANLLSSTIPEPTLVLVETRTDFVQGPAALTKSQNLREKKYLNTITKTASHWWIPPQREIWFLSHRSHPKEKSGQRALDPTPKRNLVKEPWIPPRRKFRVGKQERRDPKVGHQTAPPHNNNNNNSHSSKTWRLRRR